MPDTLQGLLHTSQLSSETVNHLFGLASQFQKLDHDNQDWCSILELPKKKPWLSFYFLEPSTRTRHSFEAAAARLGIGVAICEGGIMSSASKGESPAETFFTLEAMRPDLFVVRSNTNEDLQSAMENSPIPVVSAGTGAEEHPTQALLDAFTLKQNGKTQLHDNKLLFIGDVGHSRVASSHLALSKIMGYEIAYSCPDVMKPTKPDWSSVQRFENLEEGLEWSTACMALRPQKERHKESFDFESYTREYCLTPERVKKLSSEGLIMHPGPYVPGEDFDLELLSDPRCVVRTLVSNGVYIRAALFAHILGWSQS